MKNPSLNIIVTECCSTGGFPLEEACEHCYLNQVLFLCIVKIMLDILLIFCYFQHFNSVLHILYIQYLANKAQDLVELSAGRKYIGRKWLFKKKFNEEGKVEKYKAWLVAKGYCQVEGIDFCNIFSSIAKLNSILQNLTWN